MLANRSQLGKMPLFGATLAEAFQETLRGRTLHDGPEREAIAEVDDGEELSALACGEHVDLLLGLVPPLGLVGLHYCFSAYLASADGDALLAEQRLDVASRLARVTLSIAIGAYAVATIALFSR